MAMQAMNFQNAPIIGDPVAANILPSIQKGMQLYYQPKEEQQKIQALQLANALSQNKLNYAPQMSQADLATKQAMAPYYKAQTSSINEKSKLDPLNALISAQNSTRLNSRFGNAYQLSKMLSNMSPSARATWIAQNPDAYNQATNDLANGMKNTDDAGLSPQITALAKGIASYYGGTPNDNKPSSNGTSRSVPQFVMPPIPSDQQIATSPLTVKPNQTQQLQNSGIASTVPFNTNPDQSNQIKLAEEMSANKSLTTESILRQAESSVNLDKFLSDNREDYSRVIKSISPYAGIMGKGKLTLDGLRGENPQAFQDYQWYMNAFVPNMKTMVTQMESGSIAPKAKQELQKMFTGVIDNYKTDPVSSIKYSNQLIKLLGSISDQRINTAQPIFKDTFNKAYGFNGIPSPYVANDGSSQVNSIPKAPIGSVTIQTPNGSYQFVAKENLQKAIARGAREATNG